MPITRKIGFTVAAAVVGVGALAGVAGCTTSAAETAASSPSTSQAPAADVESDVSELAALLAEQVGVDETAADTAITDFMEANKPADRPSGEAPADEGSASSAEPTTGEAPDGTPPAPPEGESGEQPAGGPPAGSGGGMMLADETARAELAVYLATELEADEAEIATVLDDYAAQTQSSMEPSASASPTS